MRKSDHVCDLIYIIKVFPTHGLGRLGLRVDAPLPPDGLSVGHQFVREIPFELHFPKIVLVLVL